MGFFDRMRQKKELERLESALASSPTPQLYLDLADRHIVAGEIGRAFEVIEAGHRTFPSSEAVFKVYVSLKKRHVQDSIRDLHFEIERSPSSSAYARLASLYREIQEEERCVDICREAIEKYPSDDSPHQILGEIRLDRFRADRYHKDGRMAIEHLEKAVERNETNYKALLQLAKIYLEIGAVGHCLKRLRDIQTFAPSDPAVEDILSAAASCPPSESEDVDELLRQVEARGRMLFPLAPGRRTRQRTRTSTTGVEIDAARASAGIGRFAQLPGFLAAGVSVEERGVIAFADGGGGDGSEFSTSVLDYVQAVAAHARRMDIGNLARAQVDGGFGQLYVVRVERIVLALLLGQALDPERVWGEMQSFLDGCCTSDGGESP